MYKPLDVDTIIAIRNLLWNISNFIKQDSKPTKYNELKHNILCTMGYILVSLEDATTNNPNVDKYKLLQDAMNQALDEFAKE